MTPRQARNIARHLERQGVRRIPPQYLNILLGTDFDNPEKGRSRRKRMEQRNRALGKLTVPAIRRLEVQA